MKISPVKHVTDEFAREFWKTLRPVMIQLKKEFPKVRKTSDINSMVKKVFAKYNVKGQLKKTILAGMHKGYKVKGRTE
jgi:hypothetical protein